MDTFELLPTLAQGELSETSAPEVVAAVFRSRASGTLWLETQKTGELRMFFRAGDMCGSGAFASFKTLAHVLLENEWVGALDIDSSGTEALEKKKRHGEVLIERRLLTKEQLRAALAAQHRANLMTLLLTVEGRYDWRGTEPPPPWSREVCVDPVSLIVDALGTDQHAARRRRVIEWLGKHRARFSPDWPELKGRLALEQLDRRATDLFSKPRTIAELMQATSLAPDRVEALFAGLLLAGALEPDIGAGRPQPAEEPEEVESEPVVELELAPEVAPDEETGLVSAESAEDEPLELDLDRAGRAAAAAGPASTGSDEGTSRDLRKRMLARGIRNLGGVHAPEREAEQNAEPVAPPTGRIDLEAVPDEDRAFVEEVRGKVRLMDGQDAYARLGVSSGASTDTIKQAYLQAAKLYHPDRASGSLARLQPELQRVFHVLKEAYEHIGTSEARARYDKELRAGPASGPTTRREEATMNLKMGEVLLKKRDFEGAIAKLRRAVDLDPSGDGLAALAWGLASDPKQSAAGKEEAASLINRALRAHGVTARTFYVAGVLWRTKDPDSAVDAFRKALEIDPQHSDASLELRLIEQRRGKTQKGGGVLSGLLFGKRKPES